VGVRAANGVPEARLVSFGLAGALHDGLRVGDVLDATRVVDSGGVTLWEGSPLGVVGAREATLLASDVLVHDATERRRLHESSGADAVDMESGVLAASGRLAGAVRAIADVPASTVEGVDDTVHADGTTNVVGLVRWVATKRGDALRSMRDALTALRALQGCAA
jgi:nucleoside phosphorylase